MHQFDFFSPKTDIDARAFCIGQCRSDTIIDFINYIPRHIEETDLIDLNINFLTWQSTNEYTNSICCWLLSLTITIIIIIVISIVCTTLVCILCCAVKKIFWKEIFIQIFFLLVKNILEPQPPPLATVALQIWQVAVEVASISKLVFSLYVSYTDCKHITEVKRSASGSY